RRGKAARRAGRRPDGRPSRLHGNGKAGTRFHGHGRHGAPRADEKRHPDVPAGGAGGAARRDGKAKNEKRQDQPTHGGGNNPFSGHDAATSSRMRYRSTIRLTPQPKVVSEARHLAST